LRPHCDEFKLRHYLDIAFTTFTAPVVALTVRQALQHRDVLVLAGSNFLFNITSYGFIIWIPKIIRRRSGLNVLQVTLLSAIPFLAAIPAMLTVSGIRIKRRSGGCMQDYRPCSWESRWR
jgi:hypothetical protein